MKLKDLPGLIKQTFTEWSEDKAPRLAAALAYYTAFSLAPVLVIAIAVAGLVINRQQAQDLVIAQMNTLAGEQGGALLQTMLEASQDIGSSIAAAAAGVVLLIFGATGVFGQLQDALNTMWEVAPKPNQGILGLLRRRLFSFTMVLAVAFLLLVSLVISSVLAAFSEWTTGLFPGFETILQIVNFIISFIVITVLFALLFKYVPDAKIEWRDVWPGAAVTALLFTAGKFLIGLYLGSGSVTEQFGGAGALVVLLLWVYYSAQICFFGAEFTQVYANRFGSRVVPDEHAAAVTEETRAQEGIPHKETQADAGSRPAQGDAGARATGIVPVLPVTGSTESMTPLPPAAQSPAALSYGAFIALVLGAVTTFGGYLLGLNSRRKR